MGSEHTNRIKAVLDLHDYLDTLGDDRPPLGAFLKGLGIEPVVMSDAVITAAKATSIAIPEAAIEIVNQLFKLGVTIGYKYAIKKSMEESFGCIEDGQGPNGSPSGGEDASN
jgi:hypothetical protein